MSLIGAAAITGGASLTSGALGALSAKGSVKRQINWEREKAQNAHQWEVEDLKKAGINTALTAGGGGANAGSIGDSSYDYGRTAEGVAKAGEQAIGAMVAEADIEKKGAETENINAETDYTTGVKTKKTAKEIQKIQDESKEIQANTNLIKAETENKRLEHTYIKENIQNIIEDTNLKGYQKDKAVQEIKRLMTENKYAGWKEVSEIVGKYGGTIRDVGIGLGGTKNVTFGNNAKNITKIKQRKR